MEEPDLKRGEIGTNLNDSYPTEGLTPPLCPSSCLVWGGALLSALLSIVGTLLEGPVFTLSPLSHSTTRCPKRP